MFKNSNCKSLNYLSCNVKFQIIIGAVLMQQCRRRRVFATSTGRESAFDCVSCIYGPDRVVQNQGLTHYRRVLYWMEALVI